MSRFSRVPLSLPRVLGAWVLLLPGVIAFQPTFGGLIGYVAAFVAITVGAGIALVAASRRWGIAYWFAALLGGYFLLGGPLAVPDTTIAGFIPSSTTLHKLVLLLFQSWNDLLTVATPAGDFSGPAAVPLIAGLLAGAGFVGVVRSTRAVFWPLSIPLLWLGFAIAFGTRTAPTAVWLGAVFGSGVLAWLSTHRLAGTRTANAHILLRKDKGLSRTTSKAVAAGVVIVLAAGAAIGVNLLTGDRVNRQVLRDNVAPPLNLQEYASPLMKYRLYELTMKDDVLFTVEGMPKGARLRLAVLDTYDGTVFNVSQNSNRYLRSGRDLPWTPQEDIASATVKIVGYKDVWVPTFGETSRLEFVGSNAESQGRGLYFNNSTKQALTTAGMTEGAGLSVEGVPEVPLDEKARESIKLAGLGSAPLATVTRVPDVLSKAATDWTSEAVSTFEQLTKISEQLREQGYYSDGSDQKSRSGHTTERLGSMFSANTWVGDDEQYATAMALMATQLGIPVRVVLGFHPLEDNAPTDVWEVKGTEAHVWVEADLDGAGWVSFDPTPDRDKLPQTDVPRPKPKPKPQVDPPPNPPEKLPEEPVIADEEAVNVDEEDKDDEDSLLGYVLLIIGAAAGGIGVLASPFLVILLLKSRRAKRRRETGEIPDQLAGAWDEVVDRARDLGYQAPTSNTRREAAANLQSAYPETGVDVLAHRIDASIFGAVALDERYREAAWDDVKGLKTALLAHVPWHARPRAVFSTRSLRRRRTEAALRPQRKVRTAKLSVAPAAAEQLKES